jgi:hypothetical protein
LVRESFRQVDTAVRELHQFWRGFAGNFKDYCIGDKGVSAAMQQVFDDMAVAFWLPDIVENNCPSK